MKLSRIPARDWVELLRARRNGDDTVYPGLEYNVVARLRGILTGQYAAVWEYLYVRKQIERLWNIHATGKEPLHHSAKVSLATGMLPLHPIEPISMLVAGSRQQVVHPTSIRDHLKNWAAMIGME